MTVKVTTIAVGTVLYGFCGGHFGRDSYEDKRVEAIGADWLVVRNVSYPYNVGFFGGDPNVLLEYTVAPEEDYGA